MADEDILRGLPSLITPSVCVKGLVSGFRLGVKNRAAGEDDLVIKVVGRPIRCCCWGCPTPGAESCGLLGKLLSAEWALFCVSIAWAMSMLEKLPVQGIGTVSSTSERLVNMERKAAPTEDDRLAADDFEVS